MEEAFSIWFLIGAALVFFMQASTSCFFMASFSKSHLSPSCVKSASRENKSNGLQNFHIH